MFLDYGLVLGEADAERLVVIDVTSKPLDVYTELMQRLVSTD